MSDIQITKPVNIRKQVLPSIDFMRVICAFMVVVIHTQSKGGQDVIGYFISQIFPRVAVPFFFMISGYFLSLSLSKKQDIRIIFRYLKRVIVTYALWSIIYYALSVQYNLKNNIPTVAATKHFLINLISIGSNYHLWYFPALIFSVLVFALFYKFNKLKALIWLSILLYIIGLLGVAYHEIGIEVPVLNLLYNSSQFTPISRIVLMGVPFLVLGHIINIHKEHFSRVSGKRSLTILIAIIICFLLEIFIVKNFGISKGITVTIALYFLTGWVLILCIKNPMMNILKHSMNLRYISNFTYYSHPIYIMIVDNFFLKTFDQSLTQIPEVFIVFFLTTITAIIISKINNRYLLKLVA